MIYMKMRYRKFGNRVIGMSFRNWVVVKENLIQLPTNQYLHKSIDHFEFGITRNVKCVPVCKFLTTRTSKSLFVLVRTRYNITLSMLVSV
jgi:hypothetical protein